jgi:molybdate transport system ATP-binding protein
MKKKTGLANDKEYLIRIENCDVSFDGRRVLHRVSWELRPGEHWAVIGRNGSGKSTFLRLLPGEVRPVPDRGRLTYLLDGEEQDTPVGMGEYIASVTPELHNAYIRNGWEMSGEEVVHTGFFHSVWLHERPRPELIDAAAELMRRLGIGGLREKSILAMSQGEARKVLIARALAARPAVLLLDEICDGLDAPSRETILAVVEEAARSGTQIVYATHRPEELVPAISHVLLLREGRIYSSGRRNGGAPVLPPLQVGGAEAHAEKKPALSRPPRRRVKGGLLFRAEKANVHIDGRMILDRISWRLARGENWAVLGRNGSGKSTLLKLLSGDLHPALGGEVNWFGEEGNRNIWETRERIGFVSPELQALYDDDLAGEKVVVSGFFSSRGLYRKATEQQRDKARALIAALNLGKLGRKRVGRMSYGEMRKLLIARALVNDPDILILDEPCGGLDGPSREEFLGFVEAVAASGTGIVMATHHRDELVPSITHVLLMDKGRIVRQGKKEEEPDLLLLTEEV